MRFGGVFSTYVENYRCIQVLVVESDGRYHMEDPDLAGRIILRWISKKWKVGTGTGLIWLRIGTFGGLS